MELHEKIRMLRENKEIKQKDMAKQLNMQATTYNAYEMGKRTFTVDLFRNICIILNVSSDELLDININNSNNYLNKENQKVLDTVKNGLLMLQKSKE